MEFNAVAEIRRLVVKAELAKDAVAVRALKTAIDQITEVKLAAIPDGKALSTEEIATALGAEIADE